MTAGSRTQEIRFCDFEGLRVAVATVGAGPPLLLSPWWVSHVETDWHNESFRRFVELLARERTVIRYDRPGTGLSDRRDGEQAARVPDEVEVALCVMDEVGIEAADVFGVSCGCCVAAGLAASEPERVRRLVLYAPYAAGAHLAPPEVRDSITSLVAAHWGLGSRVLAEVFMPEANPADRRRFADLQRTAASAEVAAGLLERIYGFDVSDELRHVQAPTLVLHRRSDRAVKLSLGREVAARIAGARFVPLDGEAHLPWHGSVAAVVEPAVRFLDNGHARPASVDSEARDGESDLSRRETEVLRLIAGGLSDREIAATLVLSPHTIHRHVANIRAKLDQPNRAGAAAEAMRLQLI